MKQKPSLTSEQAQKLYNLWLSNFMFWVEDTLAHLIPCKIPHFHKELYTLLPKTPNIVIAAPRGFAKSMLCSVFYPLWAALFKVHNDICIISASEGLAAEWLRKIRNELETNPTIQECWGDQRSSKWTESHLTLKNGVNIRARGAGGQIRGFRPSLLVLDDVETDDSVLSEEQRSKMRDWIFKACLNTLIPGGQFVMVGTVIHYLAVFNEILCSDNGWEKRKYQAYIGGVQEAGRELWPQLWSHERLQRRKMEIGSTAFFTEFMNEPILNERAVIKPNMIREWDKLPEALTRVIAVDPAYSEDERADYKVAVAVGVDRLQNRYLETYIRTHSPTGEFIDSVLNLWVQNRGTVIALGVPNSGVEKEFFNSFMRQAAQRQLYPPVVELKNTFTSNADGRTRRNKTARVQAALQPLFESGKYRIHRNHTEVKDELLMIGASRHDDIVDAMTYAEQLIQPGMAAEPVKLYDDSEYITGGAEELIGAAADRGDTGYGV